MATLLCSSAVGLDVAVTMVFFCLAGSFAYIGGMFLNDAFDAEYDREHQPFRPIPSGEIGRASVFVTGFALLAFSFACFCLVQIDFFESVSRGTSGFFLHFRPHFLPMAAVLFGSIVVYDWIHKKFALSALFMAAARAGLILTIVSTMQSVLLIPALIASGLHFFYVCCLTLVARAESRVPLFQGKIPYLIAGISGVDALLILAFKQDLIMATICACLVPLTLGLQKWVRGD